MRTGPVRFLACLLILAAAAACNLQRSSAPEECDEMEATYVPTSLTPTGVEKVYEDPPPGEDPRFVASVLTFQDEAGTRQLVLSSGAGEMVGEFEPPEDGDLEIRGHPAVVTEAAGSHIAVWFENDADEPCAQYAVVGVMIPKEEFDKVLAGIR